MISSASASFDFWTAGRPQQKYSSTCCNDQICRLQYALQQPAALLTYRLLIRPLLLAQAYDMAAHNTAQQAQRLQRAASLFFDRLPRAAQQQLLQIFRTMDANGDGRISLLEIVRWAHAHFAAAGTSQAEILSFNTCAPVIFAFLDADANGTLDFNECKALFFISIADARSCSGCGTLLLETAYTCKFCNDMHLLSESVPTFDLCSNCNTVFNSPLRFAAARPWLMHPHRNMVTQDSDLANAMDEMFDQVQCGVCREYHRSTAQGVFGLQHVHVGRMPNEFPVCEWCITCLCSGCGNHFQGPRQTASAGQWANPSSHVCIPCRRAGINGTSLFTPTFSTAALQKMETSRAFEQCSTCKTKVKDGSLMASVLQAFTMAQKRALGAAFPQNYSNLNSMLGSSNSYGGVYTPGFNPMQASNSAFNQVDYTSLMQSISNNVGSPAFNPMQASGSAFNQVDYASIMQSISNNGLDFGGLMQSIGTMGAGGSSALDLLGAVNNMGGAVDLINAAGMCSIM